MSNYSYKTSLPAYKSNNKQMQVETILRYIKNGAETLLELSELSNLPQSTVSGRVNDLIESGSIKYADIIVYKNRKRKKIVLI